MAVAARHAARKAAGRAGAKAAPKRAAKPAAGPETRVFHVLLLSAKPVSRDIELKSDDSLYTLADVIIWSVDFDLDHAFGFFPCAGPGMYGATPRYELFADMGQATEPGVQGVKDVKISAVFAKPGDSMTLLFDYGDEWLFDVKLIAIGQAKPRARYPRMLGGLGKPPPQYPQCPDDV